MNNKPALQMTVTKQQHRFLSWMSDVLVYIVVLNLFEEFSHAIIIDSFWISILTAVLLQALIALLKLVEERVGDYFEQRNGVRPKVVGGFAKLVILFVSKLLILEIVNFVFGDQVELGHFVNVLVLILSLMAARALVGRIYVELGKIGSDKT